MIFLGIDSGTQSTKTVALELESGKILATAQHGYELISGLEPGHLEQEPSDWVEATRTGLQEVVAELGGRASEVKGIGVSGQQHGLVALDAEGNPVRAAKLWCDTSTISQCDEFAAAFGGQDGLIAKAGNGIMAGYTIPKLLWMKQNEPENFSKIRHVLLPHDYLNYWLTGQMTMEYGDASGTGVLNVRTREWDSELLGFVDPAAADLFPEVGSSQKAAGVVRGDLAAELGLPADVLVSAGGGDNMMGAIGTGNVAPGVITASFGTSGTLYGYSDEPVIDPQGEVAAFCDSTDGWMPLVCTMNVTVVTEKTRGLFGMELPAFEEAVSGIGAGADGLTFLPYLNGERSPNLPGGSGVIHGLRQDNMTPAHLARAAMEGATLGLAYGMKRFRDLGMNPSEIRLTGGGSQSPTWRQVAADAFNAEVVSLDTAEGAGLGSAIQAAHTYLAQEGQGRSYEALCGDLVALDESTRVAPGENAAGYEEQLERQMAMTDCLHEGGYL